VGKLSVLFKPVGFSPEDSLTTLMSDFSDYEDGLLHASAVRNGIDAILTRDRSGFSDSCILIIHPDEVDKYLEPGVAHGSIAFG